MGNEHGEWIMRGMADGDPRRLTSPGAVVEMVEEIGFLPLFRNSVPGFSVEEHTAPHAWWTGDEDSDPWEWRRLLAESGRVAYGKFFDKKAGFISPSWLPYFANYRRDGYDFDSRWEDGLMNRREKNIMDLLTERDPDNEIVWTAEERLSTEVKKLAGFGKGGDKNFPGILTGLQMQLYLVTVGFRRRRNKKGGEYGMPVSVLRPPEAVWGYEHVTSAYNEPPAQSRQRIINRVLELFPQADEKTVKRML